MQIYIFRNRISFSFSPFFAPRFFVQSSSPKAREVPEVSDLFKILPLPRSRRKRQFKRLLTADRFVLGFTIIGLWLLLLSSRLLSSSDRAGKKQSTKWEWKEERLSVRLFRLRKWRHTIRGTANKKTSSSWKRWKLSRLWPEWCNFLPYFNSCNNRLARIADTRRDTLFSRWQRRCPYISFSVHTSPSDTWRDTVFIRCICHFTFTYIFFRSAPNIPFSVLLLILLLSFLTWLPRNTRLQIPSAIYLLAFDSYKLVSVATFARSRFSLAQFCFLLHSSPHFDE